MCNDYDRKEWCGLESRAIRSLLKSYQSNRIMLLSIDGHVINGILDIDGYLNISDETDESVATSIYERLLDLGSPLPGTNPFYFSQLYSKDSSFRKFQRCFRQMAGLFSPYHVIIVLLCYIIFMQRSIL